MLRVMVGKTTLWNTKEEKFIEVPGVPVDFEHSLLSVSKWESKTQKVFLGPGEKTPEEIIEYLKCMIVSPEISPEVIDGLTQQNLDDINDYISGKQTATTFPNHREPAGKQGPKETVSSELIYYWMLSAGISIECEKWHLNRLLTLIRVFNVKNAKPKKMSRSEIAAKNRELNAQRRAQLGTSG